jgi:hypothetical protein
VERVRDVDGGPAWVVLQARIVGGRSGVGAGSCDVAVMVVAGYGVASLRVFGVRDSIERLL